MAKPRFQPPKGTRDLYPEDMLRRRYITQAWRDTSIRHGFEEVDGPTFESSELYAVKSGDGILGELFQAFSGKDPKDLEFIKEHDRGQLALRPEFTPTLARMYAAHAAQLSKPTKWFSIGPFFRAERPQRGRLREFLQWNADVIGDDDTVAGRTLSDTELVTVSIDALTSMGLYTDAVTCHVNDRHFLEAIFEEVGEPGDQTDVEARFALLDKRAKLNHNAFESQANAIDFDWREFDRQVEDWQSSIRLAAVGSEGFVGEVQGEEPEVTLARKPTSTLARIARELALTGYRDAWKPDPSIVRGLAYYTGTVFEVIAEGERAVAGGGRYDNLIELLGGPPTPAVGFAMGDVVLSLLLKEKNLMPEGADLLEACSRPGASLRPEAFVVTADESLDPAVRRLVADLRRGTETEGFDGKPWASDRYATRPLHARRSYKSTRKTNKLYDDARKQHAMTFVVVSAEDSATVEHIATGEKSDPIPLAAVPAKVAELTGRRS